ncbi:MAG TPA: DUF2806 domain-containing protein [Acidobacteriaceae bacterium]
MHNVSKKQPKEDPINDLLATVSDTIGDLITGVPAPIRKNAARAFTRLCTAAVEYPAALIENAIEEKRAESRTRVKLTNTSAEQIAEQMHTSPEYARAAVRKFGQKIIRERINIDQIAQLAADELRSDKPPETGGEIQDAPPISEDWMSTFEDEAAQMSSEQMHQLFARILAGEIRKPTSFSRKTVRMVAQLDNTAAALFKILCSLSISLQLPEIGVIRDARVVSMGSAGNNSLQAYGLGFDQLNILQEYGLIISDYNSWMTYSVATVRNNTVPLPLNYSGEFWAFAPKTATSVPTELMITGVALSRCGKELLPIVEKAPNQRYTEALTSFFDQQRFAMIKAGA